MTANGPDGPDPVKAGKQALTRGALQLLSRHPLLRRTFAVVGFVLLAVGLLATPLWKVNLLAWLSFGQIAGACLTIGLAAIGLWYLSRPDKG